MNEFEYLVETLFDPTMIAKADLQSHLNNRGEKGWELVNAVCIDNGFQYELIFKRNAR